MIIDATKSGFDNFIALISKAANRVFDPKYLLFSVPQSYTHSAYPSVNSRVVATAKPNGPYKGTTAFIYGRVDLGTSLPPLEINYEDGFDYLTFKRNLINSLGLIYSDVDFDVQTIPSPQGSEPAYFHIYAKPNSFVYVGKVKVKVVGGVPENARLMEDGSVRLMEDGSVRLMED